MKKEINNELAAVLQDCVIACEACIAGCLREADPAPMVRCISLDRDCADLCSLALRLLARESEIGLQFLLLCEEVCRMCSDECSKHADEHCRRCAESCLRCAEACHRHHQPIHQN